MLTLFHIFTFRFVGTFTQIGRYKMFPPFGLSSSHINSSCVTLFEKVDDESHFDFFVVMNKFDNFPSLAHLPPNTRQTQQNLFYGPNIDSNNIMRPNSNSNNLYNFFSNYTNYSNYSNPESSFSRFLFSYGYGEFIELPSYPIIIHPNETEIDFKITHTCYNGNTGMDNRDKYRKYYIIVTLLFTALVYYFAVRRNEHKKLLRMNAIIFASFCFLCALQYTSFLCNHFATDPNGTFNTYYFTLATDIFSTLFQVLLEVVIYAICARPSITYKIDFEFSWISIIVAILCLLFHCGNFYFVYIMPFTKYIDYDCFFWPFYAFFPLLSIVLFFQYRSFSRKVRSKRYRINILLTSWFVTIASFLIIGGNSANFYFGMISGGKTLLTVTVNDILILLHVILTFATTFSFESLRVKMYAKTQMNNEKKNSKSKPLSSCASVEPLLSTNDSTNSNYVTDNQLNNNTKNQNKKKSRKKNRKYHV
ncbi:hypothetical protein TRFO_18417 [Tritrichomonas foetus]|uniref:Uncharacterized protein n=1 Tax=Tritrichomonas foetus TaxID=1144522 RepID=A0A1J4KQ73_9EUKA|nr:hypothetical protein TRFO_18417 [Tritrichomonas foetus]|eukprot:OHT11940.1 hypothetical protein TRFO_18417 [Tritrichomonas foetus]